MPGHRHKDSRLKWTTTDTELEVPHPADVLTAAEVTALKAILAAGGGGGTTPIPNPPQVPPPDITPPTVSGVAAAVTTTTATVVATTNEASTVIVEYSTTGVWPGTMTAATSSGTSHSRDLTGLTPGQTYFYRVRATDTALNLRLDGNRTFTTTAAPTLPGAPTGLVATGANTAVGLAWVAPASNGGSAITGYRVYRNGASLIVLGVVLSYNNTGLTNGLTYSYTVAAITAVGEGPQSNTATATPAAAGDINPPVISNVAVSGITTTGATITWTTNEATTGFVEYGMLPEYGSQTTATASGTSHSRTLTGLNPSTTFHYRVRATDTAGNLRLDQDRTFTTAQVPNPTPPPNPPPASPIQGYGSAVTGGTGQTTVTITNLNDSGAGSFKGSIGSNRNIVVASGLVGTVTHNSLLDFVGLSNFTLDAGGITLRGWPLYFRGCSNFIVKNLRGRDQTRPGTGDSLSLDDASHDFVIDHCSLSGASDGSFDVTNNSYNGTVQWCMLGPQGYGGGSVVLSAYFTNRITYHHNLFYQGGSRNPQIGSSAAGWAESGTPLNGDVRCNLIWTPSGSYGTVISGVGQKANVVRNYYYLSGSGANQLVHTELGGVAYISGNVDKRGPAITTSATMAEIVPPVGNQVTMEATAQLAAQAVLDGAGCRVGGLDSIDQAKINAIVAAGL